MSGLHFKLVKSKSVDALNIKTKELFNDRYDYFHDNHFQSDSSQEFCVIIDNRSEISSIDKEVLDNGVTSKINDEGLLTLEHKINKMHELEKVTTMIYFYEPMEKQRFSRNMLQEQHLLLKTLKEELFRSKPVFNRTTSQQPDLLQESTNTSEDVKNFFYGCKEFETSKIYAENLLDAVNITKENLECGVQEVLINFLQSDDLKDRIASATADSVKDVIKNCFSETFPSAYLPIMEQSHCRLLKHVTKTLENAFNEVETGLATVFNSVHKTSRSLRKALEEHQVVVETHKYGNIFENFQSTLELILRNELIEWRVKLMSVLVPQLQANIWGNHSGKEVPYSLPSPPQPADPERSIIDQLMKSAAINKQIKEGDINKSFEEALSSSDLSLVMAACRAADPDDVFGAPCSLKQSVLLSLVQQLATDMVHDTQLKCRYLEGAIINLKATDQATRLHLPLVVGEIRKHLSKFLRAFPSHIASRRITLIIMAANNLLQ